MWRQKAITRKCPGTGVRLPGFEVWLLHLELSDLGQSAPLSLSFIICKPGFMTLTTLKRFFEN